MSIIEHQDGSLTYDVWYKCAGGGLVRRDALENDHPENLYNYLKSNGYTPENYGVYRQIDERYMELQDKTKAELLSLLVDSYKRIEQMEKYF